MRSFFPAALSFAASMAIGVTADLSAQDGQAMPVACEHLTSAMVLNTTISSADLVAAGAFDPPTKSRFGVAPDYSHMPAFCRVAGSIKPTSDSDIRFELWLPADNWNGRFLQTGNGGAAGAVVYRSMVDPLSRGYAVANTDTGHQGGSGDFSWAVDHPEKLVDYQYRAVHELTLVGKALTQAHYGHPPRKSYWVGCSTGGRQGLKEAQRYPADYDAIIAGAPASNWSPLMSLSVLIQRNIGPQGLGVDKLGVLKEAAIAACDAGDGVVDRVITEPAECDFDPAAIQCKGSQVAGQCLNPNEVAAARRIYAGLINEAGEILIPGTGPGSEPVWAAYASPGFSIGSNYFRNVIVKDPGWDPDTFDFGTLARAERFDDGAADAMNPDLSAFFDRGGKLITYHGTTDGLIPYGNSVNYYESVVDKLGESVVENSMRFYLVPGMDHCSGGEGAFMIDWLTPMEDWVEDGNAPGTLPAARPSEVLGQASGAQRRSFTRPACVYPLVASYRGRGDQTDAASFECVASPPRRGPAGR